jgi:hypothetical protein
MSKLITARDLAERDHMNSVADWLRKSSQEAVRRGVIRRAWDGKSVSGSPVEAFVDFGRWLAKCDACGGYCYVDPDEKIFFCLRCGNQGIGMARPVLFPDEFDKIETALLARPIVDDARARNPVEKAVLGRPTVEGLARSWYPGQSQESLLKDNKRLLPGGAR